jgi:tRNA(adenine34) deaminase
VLLSGPLFTVPIGRDESVTAKRCSTLHENWMNQAIQLAREGGRFGEIPVGCVIVCDGEILGQAHNQKESTNDPTAHAEMIAIRRATRRKADWQLTKATLYVTLEPCPMCMGAILEARISRVVFGAENPERGAAKTCLPLANFPGLPTRCEVLGGVLQTACRDITQRFFKNLRATTERGEVAEPG